MQVYIIPVLARKIGMSEGQSHPRPRALYLMLQPWVRRTTSIFDISFFAVPSSCAAPSFYLASVLSSGYFFLFVIFLQSRVLFHIFCPRLIEEITNVVDPLFPKVMLVVRTPLLRAVVWVVHSSHFVEVAAERFIDLPGAAVFSVCALYVVSGSVLMGHR